MHFISNEYFTFRTADDFKTNVFRTYDGERVCSLDMRTFSYVRKSITPENFDSEIMGIYDVISQKIYTPKLETLIHFGARNIIIGPYSDMHEFKEKSKKD
jgi:hypothetical protein